MRLATNCKDVEVPHDEARLGLPHSLLYLRWPVLLARLYRLYFSTLSVHIFLPDGSWETPASYGYGSEIYAHCERDLLVLAGFSRYSPFTVLIARGKDGDWASQAAVALGSRVVRGSSLHEGKRAAGHLIETLRADCRPAGICVDGPLGPPGVAKRGVLYVARSTQRPIIPLGVAAKRKWVFSRSWSQIFLPQPFSPLVVSLSPPFRVREGTSHRDIKLLSQQLTCRLAQEQSRAEDALRVVSAS